MKIMILRFKSSLLLCYLMLACTILPVAFVSCQVAQAARAAQTAKVVDLNKLIAAGEPKHYLRIRHSKAI